MTVIFSYISAHARETCWHWKAWGVSFKLNFWQLGEGFERGLRGVGRVKKVWACEKIDLTYLKVFVVFKKRQLPGCYASCVWSFEGVFLSKVIALFCHIIFILQCLTLVSYCFQRKSLLKFSNEKVFLILWEFSNFVQFRKVIYNKPFSFPTWIKCCQKMLLAPAQSQIKWNSIAW